MADGSVIIEAKMDTSKADKELAKLKKEIASTESAIGEQEAKKSPLTAQAEKLSQEMREARAEVQKFGQQWAAGVAGADGQQAKAQERLNQIQNEYAGVVAQIDKVDAKLLPAYEKLDRMKEEAGELQKNINKAANNTKKMEKASQKAEKKMGLFARRLRGIALSAFVFNILSTGFRELTEWMGNVIKSNDKARAAIAKLKGALLTLAQPLVDVVIPAFTSLINVLSSVVAAVAHVVAVLFGTTAEEASKSAEELYNEQQALEGVGAAAKAAAKQLAPFDEINQLLGETAGSAASFIAPDFSDFSAPDLPEWLTSLTFTMRDIFFKWKGLGAEDVIQKVITALTTLAGALIGFSLGGVGGAVLGMTIGAGIGAYISDLIFDNDGVLNKEEVAKSVCTALFGLVGGIFGFMVGGPAGAIIGMSLGAGVSAYLSDIIFDNDGVISDQELLKGLCVALGALVGGIIGFAIGGPLGAAIGITVGATLTLKILDVAVAKGFSVGDIIDFAGAGVSAGVFGTYSIPGFATGSVIPPNREFIARLGDNKNEPEVVSPLSTMKQAFRETMQESGGAEGGTYTFVVNLDGKEVARNTVKHVNDMTRSAGKPILLV